MLHKNHLRGIVWNMRYYKYGGRVSITRSMLAGRIKARIDWLRERKLYKGKPDYDEETRRIERFVLASGAKSTVDERGDVMYVYDIINSHADFDRLLKQATAVWED